MPILAYGINHKTASVAIREKITFDSLQAKNALQELLAKKAVNEAVLLSTCNRTEIYSVGSNIEAIESWLNAYNHTLELDKHCYVYQDIAAVQHMLRVASGLDSMILGEPEILGQLKAAFQLASDAGTVGKQLNHLFQAVFAASKTIRSKTAIGKNSVSMAYAIVKLAKNLFSNIQNCQVMLIGAGHIIELIATHLDNQGIKKLVIANRTYEKAKQLASTIDAHAIEMQDIPHYLKNMDIIISATNSPLPILGKGMMESALRSQKRRAIFMVDLAVPRNIEPEVSDIEDIYLYHLDDLQHIISQNLKNRAEAGKQAEAMIEMEALDYMRKLRVFNTSDFIQHYRQQLHFLRDKELANGFDLLKKGEDPREVLQLISHNLVNKIMHRPTLKLREAAYNGELELLMMANELLKL